MLTASVELASIVDEAARRLRYALKAATDSAFMLLHSLSETSAARAPIDQATAFLRAQKPTDTTADNPLNEGRTP